MTVNQEIKARRLQSRSVRLVLGMLDFYGFFGVVMVLAWLVLGETSWLTGLTPSLMPGLFFPAPVLFVIGLLARRKRMVFPTLLLLGVFVWLYGAMFISRTTDLEMGNSLRLLTYNTHAATEDFDAMLAIIQESRADVVALQELSTPADLYLREKLAETHPYVAAYTNGESVMGRGIYSRYPILEESLEYNGGREIYLRAVVETNWQKVVVYNVHLSPPTWGLLINFDASFRSQNMQALLNDASQETAPFVLLGDFNMTDQTRDYRLITEQYKDAYKAAGDGLGTTFPDFGGMSFPFGLLQPIIRLDYVFHNALWIPVSARVWGNSGGSDHRPLVVTLGPTGLAQ
jgi:vancomycin resistance protein VanJ